MPPSNPPARDEERGPSRAHVAEFAPMTAAELDVLVGWAEVECARMYRGPAPVLPLTQMFGVCMLELGCTLELG